MRRTSFPSYLEIEATDKEDNRRGGSRRMVMDGRSGSNKHDTADDMHYEFANGDEPTYSYLRHPEPRSLPLRPPNPDVGGFQYVPQHHIN